jgi:hypothetical protein
METSSKISSAGWGDILIIDGDALIGTEIRVQAVIPQYPILKDKSGRFKS